MDKGVVAKSTLWVYGETKPGDCGSLLRPASKGGKLLGMHCLLRRSGMFGSEGMSVVLVREDLRDFVDDHIAKCKKFMTSCQGAIKSIPHFTVDVTHMDPVIREGHVSHMPPGDHNPVGYVEKSARGRSESNYEPSLLHKTKSQIVAQGLTKKTAILDHTDGRLLEKGFKFENQGDFMVKNCSKNSDCSLGFNPEHSRIAAADVVSRYVDLAALKRLPCKVLTRTETINGKGELEKLQNMPTNTSAGYPYGQAKWSKGKSGKKNYYTQLDLTENPNALEDRHHTSTGIIREVLGEMIQDIGDERRQGIERSHIYVPTNPKYERILRAKHRHLRKGERPAFIWMNVFKDEIVSQRKIDEARTRVICASPLDYSELDRKYFGAFINVFYSSHTLTESAVGMNPFSKDWDDLIRKMKRMGAFGFDGDYREFDSRMLNMFIEDIYGPIEEWYKNNDPNWTLEDATVRWILLKEVMSTLELISNSLYRSEHGNPSGNPLTTLLNTLFGQWLLRMYYLHCFGLESTAEHAYTDRYNADALAGMSGYHQNVCLAQYGDDNFITPSSRVEHVINSLDFAIWLRSKNIVYTAADKEAKLSRKNRPVETLSFLKVTTCHWNSSITKGMAMPYAEEMSLCKTVAWIQKNELGPVVALIDNVNDALRRVWFSGPERYNAVRSELLDAFAEANVDPGRLRTFQDGVGDWNQHLRLKTQSTSSEITMQQTHFVIQSQMMGAESPLVSAVQESNVTQVVAPPAKGVAQIERVQHTVQNARNLCRRGHLFFYQPEKDTNEDIAIPVHSIYANENLDNAPDALRRNLLNYWSSPFRVRHDTPVFTFVGNVDMQLVYRAYNPGASVAQNNELNFNLLLGRQINTNPLQDLVSVWNGPLDNGASECGVVVVKVPYTTHQNILKLPKKASDSGQDYSSGTLFLRVKPRLIEEKSGTTPAKYEVTDILRGYAQLGDSSRFGMLYLVPKLVLDAKLTPNTSIAPDTYVVPTPPDRKARVNKDLSNHGQAYVALTRGRTKYQIMSQGNVTSYTKNVNISGVVDSTLENGGSDSFEATNSVDAKASLDKPNIGVNYQTALRRAAPMLSHGSNVTYAQVLALVGGGLPSATPEVMSTSTDEMALRHLTQLNYLRTEEIYLGGEANTVVASGPLTPCPNLLTAEIGDELSVPIIEFTSNKFAYWQGGLHYRFHFAKPQPSRLRVAFVLVYGKSTVPATLVARTAQYVHYFDLSSDQLTFDVVAPYRAITPRLCIPSGPVIADKFLDYAMGNWALVVINPLRTVSNCATFVYCNMFVGSADDYKLSTYGHRNYSVRQEIGLPPPEAKAEESSYLEDNKGFTIVSQMQNASDSNGDSGVTFSESEPMVPDRKNAANVSAAPQAAQMVPEKQLDYKSLAARPQLLATFPWTISDNDLTILYRGRIPWDFIDGSAASSFHMFQYYRGVLRLTIRCQATPFHSGMLIIYFVPLTSDDEIDAHHVGSKQSQTIVQHEFLVASESNSVTIEIPFTALTSWLNTDDTTTDEGGLVIQVFNQLATGDAELDEAEISVIASFVDAEFAVIDPDAFATHRFQRSSRIDTRP